MIAKKPKPAPNWRATPFRTIMRRALFLASFALLSSFAQTAPIHAESPLELLMRERARQEPAIVTSSVRTAPITPAARSPKAHRPIAKVSTPRRRADDRLIAAAPAHLAPFQVTFISDHAPGTLVIDTSRRALYRVLNGHQAMRYGVAVGKEGFEWSGTETISARMKWPDWRPPKEMRARDPRLPEFMAGGPRNPLGARALYLGSTLYRIHGTWNPKDIGRNASSGCIRMLNAQVAELYELVQPRKTKVVVVTSLPRDMLAEGRGDTRPGSALDRIPMVVPAGFDPLAVPASQPFGRR
jgi:lipoprotein-anchoring transpeptidase ErfK/SrfK